CVLGYQPPLFPWDGEPSDVPAVDYWFWESERVWDSAHLQLQRALRRRRTTADLRRSKAPEYRPGQKVWLLTRDIRMRLPCKKLSPRFIEPGETEEPPLTLIMDEGSDYLVRDILVVAWSIWSTGRNTAPRSDRGSLGTTSLTPLFSRTSTPDTPIGQLHGAEVDHH
ncbi:hypothetical protein QTP86_030836, partial [Hemibagrus guttatus]